MNELTVAEKKHFCTLIEEKERRKNHRLFDSYFPDTGLLRRELYPKHLQFFAAGKEYEERLALAANRIGKTETMGGYELTCHLTGNYPKWWPGRKFDRPIEAWAAGKTGQTVRDIIQKKLLGPKHALGTGLIRPELIIKTTPRGGIADAIDTAYIKHASGGVSELGLKSYDQGRQSFEGTKKDVIWLDEESPHDIYIEALLRTTDTTGLSDVNGLMIVTFTPLQGMSEVVLEFLPGGQVKEVADGTKYVLMATWDDVPHLTEKAKAKLLAAIPPWQRAARTKGVPQLGAGAIYPIDEDEILVDDFAIPDHWPRAYALDVGWRKTAAVWIAQNPDTLQIYVYAEHYRGEAEPSVHATAIKARGSWIPGVLDPAADQRKQDDGKKMLKLYKEQGLILTKAKNAVEAGLIECWQGLSSGQIKVFKSLSNFRAEYRLYRRDENGKIVKKNDHLMDAFRYAIMSGIEKAIVKPVDAKAADDDPDKPRYVNGPGSGGWMR